MNRIVNFHVVSDTGWFEKIVLFLKRHYRLVSVAAVHDYFLGKTSGDHLCHITVDDGDLSFYRNVFPVLRKHQVPVSLFVSPKICSLEKNFWFQDIGGWDRPRFLHVFAEYTKLPLGFVKKFTIENLLKSQTSRQVDDLIRYYKSQMKVAGKTPQNMTVDLLREVDGSGLVTIGAHTMNHPILRNESDQDSEAEIYDSVLQLSGILNKDVRYFSYPNGIEDLDFSEREIRFLENANIDLAFTTEAKNFLATNHKYRVPRIGVSDMENFSFFRTKMLLAGCWKSITQLRRHHEIRQRRQINRVLSTLIST